MLIPSPSEISIRKKRLKYLKTVKIYGKVGLRSHKMPQITEYKPLDDGDSEFLPYFSIFFAPIATFKPLKLSMRTEKGGKKNSVLVPFLTN